jgi:uroporphyrinogen-III synthase
MSAPLANLNVIITRPLCEAERLAQKISQYHGNPFLFPMLEIHNLNSALIKKTFQKVDDLDYIIFTSRNAVRAVKTYLKSNYLAKIVAMGPSTSAALKDLGIKVDIEPTKVFNSEQLLKLLPEVSGKNILMVTGEGGRGYLEQNLLNQHTNLIRLAVYERQLPVISSEQINTIRSLQSGIVISTSCEALDNLLKIYRQHHLEKSRQKLFVLIISERMRRYARSAGLKEKQLVLAQNATDEAILECLIKWYSSLRVS